MSVAEDMDLTSIILIQRWLLLSGVFAGGTTRFTFNCLTLVIAVEAL
jgi:hypothetical protein